MCSILTVKISHFNFVGQQKKRERERKRFHEMGLTVIVVNLLLQAHTHSEKLRQNEVLNTI
jgi:hypothetical protein